MLNLGNYFPFIMNNSKILMRGFHKSKNFLNTPNGGVKMGLFGDIFERTTLQIRI